jgi:hypothetical protein
MSLNAQLEEKGKMQPKKIGFALFSLVIVITMVSIPVESASGCRWRHRRRDKTPPEVSITNPYEDEVVSGVVTVSFTATDNFRWIKRYEVYIDGELRLTLKGIRALFRRNRALNYNWDTTLETEGLHTITCRAKDLRGNWGSNEISVTVNNEPTASGDSVVLNEFLPDPYTLFSEEWIELFNPLAEDVDISGYILDDSIGVGTAPYIIPSGTIVPAKGFILFYQSITNIGLNRAGDTVNYIHYDGITLIYSFSYSSSMYDVSYGRETDGGTPWVIFEVPTPGLSNG